MTKRVRYTAIILIVFFISIFYNTVVLADEINLSNKKNLDNGKVNFQNISMKDGLSSNAITCIFQDSKGYIWIGTEDGLNQYDGNGVKVYNYENSTEDGLSSTYITSIAEDEQGYIWVGTYGGLNIIDGETENIVCYGDKNNLSSPYITDIYKDSNNTMWVGTASGLNRYDSESDKFVKYYWNDRDNEIANNYITDISEDENGFLWIATKCGIGGININELDYYAKNFGEENSKQIYAIGRSIDGYMWVASKSGIYKHNVFDKKTNIYKVRFDDSIENSIVTVLCDIEGNVWLGTSDGLVKYNEQNNTIETYKKDIAFNTSLISNSITCLFQDRNGVLWIGTDNGVSILNTAQQFSNSINDALRKMDIPYSSITSIIEDSNNDLWIGTESNGIINFIVETKETVRYIYDENNNNSLSSNKINNIFEIEKNRFVISTDRGVDVLYKDTRKIECNVTRDLREEYTNEILTIFNDGYDLWIGTNNGFFKSENGTYELVNYNENFQEKGIDNYRVVDIFQDERDKDILWLAGERYSGLIKFHKTDGIIKNYVTSKDITSISYDFVNCIEGDGNGVLWIGTNSGLNKFDIETETFIRYSQKDGLVSDYINSIEIDSCGNLWLGTNNGLSKFNIEENKFINFSEIDGIQGSHFNRGVSLNMECGQVLFGTSTGVVSFNPMEINEDTYRNENVVIGKVRINGELITLGDKNLNLKYNENNIMFQYFLPEYGRLGEINYLYKLEGVDDEWKYINRGLFSNYTLLSPGNYTFKVKAMNNTGDITEETSLNFTINSPIWKTKAAYCFYIFIFLAIIYFIWNRVKLLKAIVEKQTKEINRQMDENKKLYERSLKNEKFKNDYFVNLSHELRTPINIILSVLQLLNSLEDSGNVTKEKAKHYMDVIKKSSNNLLKIINDIIDSSKIESGAYKINKQDNVDIVYLVEETALNMSDYIKEKGLELIIDPEIEEKTICCDPKEIERCIINLIGNAVKFTESGGRISIVIKENENFVSISVEDTGLGISKDDQEFIFNRFEQGKGSDSTKVSSSGIGLTLVKYIVELHNGNVSLESEENQGSKFTITLPLV
ncbi:ligand-binding sensor domain-containing protein [Clostridium disporicum]|uniref:histidine kinase n=1 Tax=Clostridium disporicum TaxID=84024 RepID=A0A174AAV3_9CLOT|nr:sensor histidine kinase [Clostridium disporicum]CUN84900.1 sensor histidine kinase/response regulator [Clostridium disporicum]